MKFTAVLALIAGSYAIRLSGPVGPMGQPVEPFCANCTPLPVVVGAATANADPAGEPAPAGSPGRGLIGAPIIALAQTTPSPVGHRGEPLVAACTNCEPVGVVGAATANANPAGEPAGAGLPPVGVIGGVALAQTTGPVGPSGQPVHDFCANCNPLPVVVGAATANANPAGDPAPVAAPAPVGVIGGAPL